LKNSTVQRVAEIAVDQHALCTGKGQRTKDPCGECCLTAPGAGVTFWQK
jgi:hypothetical protein